MEEILEDVQEEELPIYGPKPYLTEEELYNLRSIKLNNGQDILACILGIDGNNMFVKRPCQIYRVVGEDGTSTCILMKWQAFSLPEQLHIINMPSVVTYCKITPDMKDFYILSVMNQLKEENKEMHSSIRGFVWPEWMDQPVNKTNLN